MDLTDEHRARIEPLIPEEEHRPKARRSWSWRNPRNVLKGALSMLSGRACRIEILPYPTCHGRFQRWRRMGVRDAVVRALAKDVKEEAARGRVLHRWSLCHH